MIKKNTLLILIIITLFGGFLRFYKVDKNPTSLTGDEISFGYAAYSILETGRDESGRFLPLVIESIGDYKNPLPAYLMVLSFKIFGVSDFAIRFQNALFGTLFVFFFFFFLKYLTGKDNFALLGSLFLSISPWNIFYSRFAYEPLIASFFSMLGIWFFMKMLDDRKLRFSFLSALFMVLTMYTGFAQRLFIPIFVFAISVFKIKDLLKSKKQTSLFILTFLFLSLPLVYVSLFQGASTRFKMVFIANDINYVRYVIFGYLNGLIDYIYLFFFWIKRYLDYLQPFFIFSNALQMVLPSNMGLGLLYPFEALFLGFGIFEFVKWKNRNKDILLIWLFTGIIPDSITNNEQHAGRLLHLTPVIFFLTTLGAFSFIKWVFSFKNRLLRFSFVFIFSSLFILNLVFAFLVFRVHFPYQKSESFDEGLREVVYAVLKYQDKYDKVIFDIRRGVDGPYMVSNPHMYLLFYSKYDPEKYQTIEKIRDIYQDEPYFSFDKYAFGYINWYRDSLNKNALLVGSPWSFPDEKVLGDKLLEKIYLSNGKVAFYIVSTR